MDIGCSVMILLLAALNEGLAAGFAGSTDLDALRGVLGIPAEVTPVGIIPVGHRADDRVSGSIKRGRKPNADFVHHEVW